MKQTAKQVAAQQMAAEKRKDLGKTLMKHGGKTFKSKVAYVKKHFPEVDNPEAFVAAAFREIGDIK